MDDDVLLAILPSGVGPRLQHLEGHQLERDAIGLLPRSDEGPATVDDREALLLSGTVLGHEHLRPAGDDQDLVRPDLLPAVE